jgi:UDP-N-acetyl-2-amino-2-deoxyglucuronate dehydrogenase
MKRTVRYGIIGCGVIGPWHAGALQRIRKARLVAVCDIVEEKAGKMAAEFGAEPYLDYHEMLARPDLDAVCICTPSGMHAEMAVDCARAGKHVMTEKPADITVPQIDRMIRGCRRAGVTLGCIFQRRTQPIWRKVHDTIAEGKLGKMVLGDAYLKYFRSQEYYNSAGWRGTWKWDGGGALMNQGVHCVDLLQWVMGPVKTIYARADHLARKIEVEDTAVAALTFRSGAFGVLEGATSVIGMDHRLEFHGDRGTIVVEGEHIAKWEVPGETLEQARRAETDEGSAAADPKAIGMEGHRRLLADFTDAILQDREPLIPGKEARRAVEIILGVYESARTGKPVALPLKARKPGARSPRRARRS